MVCLPPRLCGLCLHITSSSVRRLVRSAPLLVQPVLPPIPAWGPCFHPGSLAPLAPNPPSPQPDPPAQCPQPPQPRSAAAPALSFASQDCFGLVGGSSSFLSPHFRSPVVFGRDQRREKKCPTS